MKQIKISDATMKQFSESFCLSFKEKIEFSKLLDRLGADVIELEGIESLRIDSLRIKSIGAAVSDSCIAVPVSMNEESINDTWAALKSAKKPRLQVCAPTSAVQIEYIFHKKPDAMINDIRDSVAKCATLCPDVEFVANDATRSEQDFLTLAIKTAIEAGATTVTLCDTAGGMLPCELENFIALQYEKLPELKKVTLGVRCSDALSMAEACAVSAITAGVTQICAAIYPIDTVSLADIARIITARSDSLDATCKVRTTELTRITEQVERMCRGNAKKVSSGASAQDEEDVFLTADDDMSTITLAVTKLGYELSEEDSVQVYNAFREIATKKEKVGLKELEAIVASSAMQVPSAYKLDSYLITSGNTIAATAHIKLVEDGQSLEGVYMGDGSIDAAFQAIEKIVGRHYELDDFQLQAVTEGREAMGQTIVKLRSGAKVYSGIGISTDIVGAGIQAYLSALNKIIYEEEV